MCVGLGALEGEVGDLGRAVEAQGETDGAETAVDVELHLAELEAAFDVLLAHGREDERADDGKPHLAAMSVAGEHGVDPGEARVTNDVVDEIGLVAHEDDGRAGRARHSEIEVRAAGAGVVGAREPEVVAAALDGDVAVDEDGGAVGLERVDDVVGADGDVVIAEAGEALGSVEFGEDFGGYAGSAPGDGVGGRAAGDEVAGDEDEVRMKAIDDADGVLEKGGLGVLLKVDVRDLDNVEADEGVGEVAERERVMGDLDLVARVSACVGGEREPGCGATDEEAAARDGAHVRMVGSRGFEGHRE